MKYEEEAFGLGFVYKNHKLSHSRVMTSDEMDGIRLDCANTEMMYVLCGKCNEWMTHEIAGYYICSVCGTRVKESTAYRQLERENDKYMKEVEEIEVPRGCSACGGPFPDCITGCRVYRS